MATRTVFPYLNQGDYDLGVRAMQVCVARALKAAGKPTVNKKNGAYGQGTVLDLVKFKQYHNLLDVNGRINPHVFGKAAWQVAWRYATAVENGWVVKRLGQIAAAEQAAREAAQSGAFLRNRVVETARLFYERRSRYWYSLVGPAATDLWEQNRSPVRRLDCSLSSILIYKAAGAHDPTGNGFAAWKGSDTGALWRAGVKVASPRPGDLVFYGWESGLQRPQHVAVYLGGGLVESFGSTQPKILSMTYRTVFGARSYL